MMAFDAAGETSAMENSFFPSEMAFSEKTYDSSPLNRIVSQSAPGTANNWGAGSGREIKFEYDSNSQSGDAVRMFKYGTNVPSDVGLYDDNMLYKLKQIDENTNVTETFTNTLGQVILKRRYDHEPVDTYYVYDDFRNLAYILPPKALSSSLDSDAPAYPARCAK